MAFHRREMFMRMSERSGLWIRRSVWFPTLSSSHRVPSLWDAFSRSISIGRAYRLESIFIRIDTILLFGSKKEMILCLVE